jgi:hypothetical protein
MRNPGPRTTISRLAVAILVFFAPASQSISQQISAKDAATEITNLAKAIQTNITKASTDVVVAHENQAKTVHETTAKLPEERPATTTALKDAVTALSDRVVKLEAAAQAVAKSETVLLHTRYDAGHDVITKVIVQAGTLKITTGLASNVNRFDASTNPSTNPVFQAQFKAVTDANKSDQRGILDKIASTTLMANPYVSLAYSVASLFFSRDDKRKDQAAPLTCILNYSTSTAADSNWIRNSLLSLDREVRTFEAHAKSNLTAYWSAVGYSGITYEVYSAAVVQEAQDPLKRKSKAFLEGVTEPTVAGKAVVRYQLDQATLVVQEYERLLRTIDDFLGDYADIVTRSAKLTVDPVCKDVLGDTKTKIEAVGGDVVTLRKEFNDVYSVALWAPTRRALQGIPAE